MVIKDPGTEVRHVDVKSQLCYVLSHVISPLWTLISPSVQWNNKSNSNK